MVGGRRAKFFFFGAVVFGAIAGTVSWAVTGDVGEELLIGTLSGVLSALIVMFLWWDKLFVSGRNKTDRPS